MILCLVEEKAWIDGFCSKNLLEVEIHGCEDGIPIGLCFSRPVRFDKNASLVVLARAVVKRYPSTDVVESLDFTETSHGKVDL